MDNQQFAAKVQTVLEIKKDGLNVTDMQTMQKWFDSIPSPSKDSSRMLGAIMALEAVMESGSKGRGYDALVQKLEQAAGVQVDAPSQAQSITPQHGGQSHESGGHADKVGGPRTPVRTRC